MSKTNISKQALLDLEDIKKSIKEESKETIKAMLREAVKDSIREAIEDKDEEEYEVEEQPETETEEAPVEPAEAEASEDVEEQPEDEVPAEDGEWNEFSQYKTGDENTYDLTGEEDYDKIVKVYKLMKDDDQVVVKQEGNQVSLTDNETGNEYVIDLGMDSDDAVEGEGEEQEMSECVIKEEDDDIAGIPSDEEESDVELDIDNEEDDDDKPFEGKKSRKVMKENKEMLFEIDLGYTDNYQDKDPIQGLSNAEPSKSGKSWEKGVPTGTEKPWAGEAEDKGEPFEENVNEEVNECGGIMPEESVDEATSVSSQAMRKSPKVNTSTPRKEHAPKVSKHMSNAGNYEEVVEAYKRENKELRESIKDLKKAITEAYIVNTNLAKITRLFTENTVSQDEKREIVDRFANEAKTVEQSKSLYESIDKQLKQKQVTLSNTKPMSAVEGKQNVNESTFKSKDLLNTLDLIKRMQNC